MRTLLCILGLFLLSAGNRLAAQTGVTVIYYDGTSQSFSVDSTGKLFFAADNLQIQTAESSSITVIPVSIVRKVVFTDALTPLPVNLVSFQVSSANCVANATWSTGTEENFSHFELQYSTNSNSFTDYIRVEPTGSNSLYSVTIPGLKGTIYYRLKMVDRDGAAKYSDVMFNEVSCSDKEKPTIYPNPATHQIRIKTNSTDILSVRIFTSTGQVLLQGNYQPNAAIDISSFASGLYFLQVNGFTIKFTKK